MEYVLIKKFARLLGVYPLARWVNRHFINRDELKQERSDREFYATILHKGDLVFDVGANYGEKTRVFLGLGAKVIAFEPQPDCMEELKSRCGNNRNLVPIQAAVSSTAGTARFYVRSHRGKSGMRENWQNHVSANIEERTFDVETVELDTMIATYGKPVYIKIDVEGFEYEVLKGLSQQVPLLSFEYHFNDNSAKQAVDCIEYLSTLGELQLNITPAENLVFEYAWWTNKLEFIEYFLRDIKKKPEYNYGDIWIRTDFYSSDRVSK